jgi:integrase
MPIYIYCKQCKANSPTTAKICQKCSEPFPNQNKRYRVSVKTAGKAVTRFTHSLTVAKELENALRGDLQRGKHAIYIKIRVPTLNDLWDRYLPWAKENKRSWADDASRYEQHIRPALGRLPLDKITPLAIERMKSNLKRERTRRGEPYAPATVKHVLVIIRRLFNLARRWAIYPGPNPMELVSMPKIDNTTIRFLSDDELTRLLKVLDGWPCRESVDIVKFAMLTGLRKGEILGLRWNAVDLENGYIRLVAPKGGRTVTLPISDAASDVLRGRARVYAWVFPGRGGGRRTDFAKPFARIMTAAGIGSFRFHDLRHNYASQLASAGVPLATIMQLLTHKEIKTTMKYAHLMPGALQDAAFASAGIILGNGTAKVALKTPTR